MKAVLNKQDFLDLYIAGEFGNRMPCWRTEREWKESGYEGPICLRRLSEDVITMYEVSPCMCTEKHFISAMVPSEVETKLRLQGKLRKTSFGTEVLCTAVAKPMKIALAEQSRIVVKAQAWMLLMETMDFASYKQLSHLVEMYPGHTITFSSYTGECGIIPDRNTLFWEVRR